MLVCDVSYPPSQVPWIYAGDLTGAGLSRPIVVVVAFPGARTQMSPCLEETSRLQNSPMGYGARCAGPGALVRVVQ